MSTGTFNKISVNTALTTNLVVTRNLTVSGVIQANQIQSLDSVTATVDDSTLVVDAKNISRGKAYVDCNQSILNAFSITGADDTKVYLANVWLDVTDGGSPEYVYVAPGLNNEPYQDVLVEASLSPLLHVSTLIMLPTP